MQSEYTVVLTAGGRVRGASISEAEFQHMHAIIEALITAYPLEITAVNDRLGMLTMRLDQDQVDQLRLNPNVYSVELTKQHKSQLNVQTRAGWALARLCGSVYDTYTYTSTGKGVTVYVIDSGVEISHDEFTGRIRKLGDTTLTPRDSHGTHVAGLVGGSLSGVAKEVQIVDVQATDANGEFPTSNLLTAINNVLLDEVLGPKVVNMSLGGPADEPLDWAVEAMIADGIIVIVSAGNDGVDAGTQSPARVPDAITVAASDQTDARAAFSNFGSVVDAIAPGVDVLSAITGNSFGVMTGTSMSAPLVAGIAARYLELCPDATVTDIKSVLLPNIVARSEFTVSKSGSAVTTGLKKGRVRAWYKDEFDQVQYGPWVSVSSLLELSVTRRNLGTGTKQFSTDVATAVLTPASLPTVIPAPGATIGLTVNIDEVYAYSLQLGYATGTFSYAGLLSAVPNIGQLVDVQGINGTVIRVGPTLSRSEPGTHVEGRLLPLFTNELVAAHYPERASGVPYTASALVAAIAAKAGTNVAFAGVDNKLRSFEFTGRFIDALNRLATEACAVLLQQKGSWYVVPVDYSIGAYTVPDSTVISVKQNYQQDILDQAVSLFEEYKAAGLDIGKKKRALARLKSEGAAADGSAASAPSYASIVSIGDITFDFGRKNKSFKPLDSSIRIEGGYWDEWQEGKTGRETDYYQVLAEPIKGCKSLSMARLFVEVKQPSNASGLYFARGKLINLTTPFWTGSETGWGYIKVERRMVTTPEGDESRLFIEFSIVPSDAMQQYTNWMAPIRVDAQQYVCDLEIGYIPITEVKSLFNGTIAKDKNPIMYNGKLVAALPVLGGEVVSGDSALAWQYNSTTKQFTTQAGALIATLIGDRIVGTDGYSYGSVLQDYVVIGDQGRVIGRVDKVTGAIYDYAGTNLGTYVAPLWVAANGVVTKNSSTVGTIYGGDTQTPRIALNTPISGNTSSDFYRRAALARLDADKALLQNELDIAGAKIACLERALTRLKIPLAPLRAAIAAWDSYNAATELLTQSDENQVAPSATAISALETAAQAATDAAMQALCSGTARLLVTEVTMLYNNTLPLPGNALTVQGASLPAAGIVQTVSSTFSNTSATVTIVSNLWT